MSGSVLDALTPGEKGALLDELLLARPDLTTAAENLAARRLETADRATIAEQVSTALKSLDHELLASRAGYHPSTGYVHETQAAHDLLGETLQPFYDDIERRAALGKAEAALETALGVLLGLYDCRGYYDDEAVLAYAESYPADEAHWVSERLRKLGIPFPEHELQSAMPEWDLS